jgi:hypothetical protein
MALDTSAVTWGELKARVLRPFGKQGDSDALVIADTILGDVILDLQNKRNWSWLNVATTLNCPTTGAVTLPSKFKHFYSVVKPGERPLWQMSQREFDLYNPTGGSLGAMYVYIPTNLHESSQFIVKDAPPTAVSINVNYLRRITVPTASTATIDVPEDAMSFIVNDAKLRLAGEYEAPGESTQIWKLTRDDSLAGLFHAEFFKPDRHMQTHSRSDWFGISDYDDFGNHAP